MRNDLTVIYYTGHTERPEFEERIKANLLKTIDNLPLISVSQKPIDFGKNICVGNVGVSVHNAWRQLLIGAEAATTKFVCTAESDYLYPKEYFDFVPEDENSFYMPDPFYVLSSQHGKDHAFRLKPQGCEGALIMGREFLIKRIHEMLDPYGIWRDSLDYRIHLFRKGQAKRFKINIPVIMFKTDKGMTQRDAHSWERELNLPYWGGAAELLRRYINPWNYDHLRHSRAYGDKQTYGIALDWLKTCPEIEDWGCGPGYFGKLLPFDIKYRGIDMAMFRNGSSEQIDLGEYTSKVSGILIRHVLEHNYSWKRILENALSSFVYRMCVIMFIPPGDNSDPINVSESYLPEFQLSKKVLLEMFQPYLKNVQYLDTRSQYRNEVIYFLEKS